VTIALLVLAGCSSGSTPPPSAEAPPPPESTATAETTETGGATGTAEAPAATDDDVATEQGMAETAVAEQTDAVTENQAAEIAAGGPIPIDEETAQQYVKDGAVFVNVDPHDEYAYERIAGTLDVPVQNLIDYIDDWKKTEPIVLTSRTSPRSRSGAAYLAREGFQEVYYLDNGHNSWEGEFDGEHHRRITQPPKLYYFYWSKVAPGWEGTLVRDMREIEEELEQVEADYPGIDYEFIDGYYYPNEVFSVMDRYDLEYANVDGRDIVVVPQWVLIDPNGDIEQVYAMPAAQELNRVFGWIYKMSQEQGYKESLRYRPGGDFNPDNTWHQPPGVHLDTAIDR
jgi:rhodanese-related sulfurtransferase